MPSPSSIMSSKYIDEEAPIFIVSNKGILKMKSGHHHRHINVKGLFKHMKLKDLLRKKSPEKIEKIITEARFGYVNAQGKERINRELLEKFKEIKKSRVEIAPSDEPIDSENTLEALNPDNTTFEDFFSHVEAMNDEEYDQFTTLIRTLILSVVELKKEQSEKITSQKSSERAQAAASPNSSERYARQIEKKLTSIADNLIKSFSEDAREEDAKRNRAYQEKQIKQEELKKEIKTQQRKKWDILVSNIVRDLVDYALDKSDRVAKVAKR